MHLDHFLCIRVHFVSVCAAYGKRGLVSLPIKRATPTAPIVRSTAPIVTRLDGESTGRVRLLAGVTGCKKHLTGACVVDQRALFLVAHDRHCLLVQITGAKHGRTFVC